MGQIELNVILSFQMTQPQNMVKHLWKTTLPQPFKVNKVTGMFQKLGL